MSAKHTPGPWKVVVNGNPLCAGIVAVIEHSPDRHIAVQEDHFGGPWCAPNTWDANAALIAAAPDLLEALRPIGAAYPDDPGTSDLYDEQPVTITLGDVRRAWRAIRKAEA